MYLHLDQNTAALNAEELRCAKQAEKEDVLEPEIDQYALSLAATYSDHPILVTAFNDAFGNDDDFTAAMHTLFTEILLMGKKACVPADVVEQVELIAKRVFHDQARREIMGPQS